MHNFYNTSKLKLNPSKTKYLINCKKSQKDKIKDFKLTLNNENIYPEGNVRILGVLFSNDNTYTVYCNDLISQINYRFINMLKVKSLTNPQTRIKFANAFLLGKLNYALILFYNCKKSDLKKLHSLYMKIARSCHQVYPYKKTNKKVLAHNKWHSIEELIKVRVLNFLHGIILNKSPENVYRNLVIPNRQSKDIRYTADFKFKNIYTDFIKLYNRIPGEYRNMNKKGFKLKINKYVTQMN